jgi:hypothetical protein
MTRWGAREDVFGSVVQGKSQSNEGRSNLRDSDSSSHRHTAAARVCIGAKKCWDTNR